MLEGETLVSASEPLPLCELFELFELVFDATATRWP